MKRILSIAYIIMIFNSLILAQSEVLVLKGKVFDQANNEGIAFVSIGIEGTYAGVASNLDGNFELRFPEEYKSKNLFFSAIGYKNISFPISELIARPEISIPLTPQSYNIDAVEILAESKVLFRILRTASERIPQNYLSVPVNLKLYYEEHQSIDQGVTNATKSIIDLYDATAYSKPSWADAFKNRFYKTIEMQKPVPSNSFLSSVNLIDELLEMDIARLSNTILNPKLNNGFNLRLEAKTRFDGDSVWIISYEAKKLNLAYTGSFYPSSYKGKIYISKSDYVVLRNEIHLTDSKANPQGRSLAVKSNPVTNIQMNIVTGYKKVGGKYLLSFIDCEKQFTSPEKQPVYESGKLIVLGTEANQTSVLTGREYFTETKPNETFWQSFKIPSK